MKLETRVERRERLEAAAKAIQERAAEARSTMTPSQLARAEGRRHQSDRERNRRLRQRNACKQRS